MKWSYQEMTIIFLKSRTMRYMHMCQLKNRSEGFVGVQLMHYKRCKYGGQNTACQLHATFCSLPSLLTSCLAVHDLTNCVQLVFCQAGSEGSACSH